MFLYLKIAGGFKQKSSRPIEAHVRIVSYNIFFYVEKRAKYVCTLLYCILRSCVFLWQLRFRNKFLHLFS